MRETHLPFSQVHDYPSSPQHFLTVPVRRLRFQTLSSAACLLNDLRSLNFPEIVYFHPCSFPDFENRIYMVATVFYMGRTMENTSVCLNRKFPLCPHGSLRTEKELRPFIVPVSYNSLWARVGRRTACACPCRCAFSRRNGVDIHVC